MAHLSLPQAEAHLLLVYIRVLVVHRVCDHGHLGGVRAHLVRMRICTRTHMSLPASNTGGQIMLGLAMLLTLSAPVPAEESLAPSHLL